MKNRILIVIIKSVFFCIILSACNENKSRNLNLKTDLIKQLVASEEIHSVKINGKLVILKKGFCETNNCDKYFYDFKNEFLIYSIEEAFMRRINKYIIIESIDESSDQIKLEKWSKGEMEKILLGT